MPVDDTAPKTNLPNDYKDSVNLPRTDFPMKASLPQREPAILKRWEEMRVYERIIEQNEGRPRFVMHDGPPYANGHIHQGHVLNKVLKDMVVKYANMSGKQSEFIPGWDCHGLPIELKSEEELGGRKKGLSKIDIRHACRAYAQRFIDIQRAEFKRIGVLARWDEPYLTMSFDYEATIVRELAKFVARGSLVRGKKPVYWCVKDRTALAEAEVEYDDHKSPSIYVAFPLLGDLPGQVLPQKKAELVIWTTTPWTLPANLAICVHPEITYVAIELKGRVLVVAKDLVSNFVAQVAPDQAANPPHVLASFSGKELEGLKYRHVLNGKNCPVILGDHVTLDSGTGLVHTAPGHGAEDYEVGLSYGLETLSPVDAGGRFTEEAGEFAGQNIFEANQKIVDKLHSLQVLLSDPQAQIAHSYPHCWRCKKPVIFRATAQWFVSMERNNLRQKALEQIDRVRWIPKWGRERIRKMIETRPDWCVSRQRVWGVPIPVFYCDHCSEPLLSAEIMERVAQTFEKEGADAWFTHPASDFLPAGSTCKKCGGTQFIKEEDILDVWFDSGVSYAAVAAKRERLHVPVDLYLEGSDQHRGWFHSNLLCAVGTRDEAPYRAVLTHGFVVDGEGKKLSKSAGNYVPFDKVLQELGAEILRLWVASSDYRDDIRVSKKILDGLTEGYRKIRNTFRYALGNLHDFNPQSHAVSVEQLPLIDRWALYRLNQLIAKVRKAYDEYEFHVVYHAVLDFCATDLSAVYFDILKDRLYTAGTNSPGRRAAQTVLHRVLSDLLRLLAPVMSFTCEEAYGFLPHRDQESIFLCGLPEAVTQSSETEAMAARFDQLLQVRSEVQKVLEVARRDKLIGSSLEAKVVLHSDGDLKKLLQAHAADLAAIFIVSQVEQVEGPLASVAKSESLDLQIKVERATGSKCPRCWNYSEAIDAAHPVCPKCAQALTGHS